MDNFFIYALFSKAFLTACISPFMNYEFCLKKVIFILSSPIHFSPLARTPPERNVIVIGQEYSDRRESEVVESRHVVGSRF